jgi:hypothetical protein
MKPAQNRISHHAAVGRLTPSLLTAFTLAYLLTAVWIGMWFHRFALVHNLSTDSRDTVKAAMGVVVTMSALVLGLLVQSTKSYYDSTRAHMMATAAKFSLLHRILTIFGPQAAEVRGKLRALIEEAIRRMWSDDAGIREESKLKNQIGDEFYVALLRLEAHDDPEQAIKAEAMSLTHDIAEVRSLMDAQSLPSISKPMLMMLVHWLVITFFSTSLIAPSTGIAKLALIASAVCVAGAIFLIVDLDRPFSGFLRISGEPMLNVLRQFGPV